MDENKEWLTSHDELYFQWLISELNISDEVLACDIFTSGLMDRLEEISKVPFKYSIQTDYNREFDGKKLRVKYYKEKATEGMLKTPSSVLEMMVGLSKRVCEDILGDDSPWNLFLLMLKNLGIFDARGKVCEENELGGKIETWLDRKFDYNGNGSPFPLKNNIEGIDQRKIDIWQQLSLYLDDIKYSLE